MIKISNKTDRYHQVSHAVIYNIQVNRSSLLAEIAENKLRLVVHLPQHKKRYKTKVTTYVFTATMLPISSSAGITAAAGTRLALNLLLETRSKSLPFQSTTKSSC